MLIVCPLAPDNPHRQPPTHTGRIEFASVVNLTLMGVPGHSDWPPRCLNVVQAEGAFALPNFVDPTWYPLVCAISLVWDLKPVTHEEFAETKDFVNTTTTSRQQIARIAES